MSVWSRRASRQMAQTSSSVRFPHSLQKRTRSFTSSIAADSASASSRGRCSRWNASRCAVRVPTPGSRESCATRLSTAGEITRPLCLGRRLEPCQYRPVDVAELDGIPLFAGLGSSTREQVARLSDEVDVPAGKELAHQGNFAHEFFVILDGRAEVTQDGRIVRQLGPGDFFGEIGVLESERRTATVTASTPMRLAVLFAPSFRQIEATMPEVAREVRGAIRERLGPSGQSAT